MSFRQLLDHTTPSTKIHTLARIVTSLKGLFPKNVQLLNRCRNWLKISKNLLSDWLKIGNTAEAQSKLTSQFHLNHIQDNQDVEMAVADKHGPETSNTDWIHPAVNPVWQASENLPEMWTYH